jgi:hypothetical protein
MNSTSKRCATCKGYGRKRHVRTDGYVRVYVPGHPLANSDDYALEHRVVLYDAGVSVPKGAHVHHKNEDRADNRLENLELLGESEHHRYHIAKAGVVTNQYGTFPLRRLRSDAA